MAGETIYSMVEPATVSLLNAYSVKLPPKYLRVDYRPGLLSTLVYEASFCSGHQSMQRCIRVKILMIRDSVLSPDTTSTSIELQIGKLSTLLARQDDQGGNLYEDLEIKWMENKSSHLVIPYQQN